MPSFLRNAFALVAGIAIGGSVNMALIVLGPSIIAPPAGVDVTNAESFRASIHLFEPKHFVAPFLAHALGTLAGALAAFFVAATHKAAFAYVIGAIFLCGGIAASFMIPAPAWFIVLDLSAAYLPMSWIGLLIGARMQPGNAGARERQGT